MATQADQGWWVLIVAGASFLAADTIADMSVHLLPRSSPPFEVRFDPIEMPVEAKKEVVPTASESTIGTSLSCEGDQQDSRESQPRRLLRRKRSR